MIKEWSNLAKVVQARTYARNDYGTPEQWSDTVERVIQGNIRGHNVSEQEVKQLRYLLTNRKAGPGGRGWWFSGSPPHEKLGGTALNNCWFTTSEDWANFILAQDLLMLGGGVGLSVEHRFTSRLPKVRRDVVISHKDTKDADFIIPDSREGWNELIRRVLESFFVTGKSFSFSTVCVRGYGEKIKGFGGTSSGPIPLIDLVKNLSIILSNRSGKAVRPIDAADILCAIADMVVMGNVRRSAIIILGDPWDKDYLKAKRWDLNNIPNYRARANFSVVVDDIDDLHPLFWKTYEHGEPFGIVNRTNIQKYGRMGELKHDSAIGVNPCQPAWATVLTPKGISTIGNINIGDTIWSGKQWTKITNKWSTGSKEVLAYRTRAGTFYGTSNHKVVSNGIKVEAYEADSIDCNKGPGHGSLMWNLDHNPQDIIDGLVLGDGTVHKASNNLVLLIIGQKDQDWLNSEVSGLIGEHRPGIKNGSYEVKTTLSSSEVCLTYNRKIPDRFKFGTPLVQVAFLRGLYSANGSVVSQRITLKAASFSVIEDVQQMLSSLGIGSYYTVNKSHETTFNNGTYTCRESYDLNISTDRSKFIKMIGFINKDKQKKLNDMCENIKDGLPKNNYEIVEVEPISVEEVFDLTVEAAEHTYWTGGVLVSNCGEATLEGGAGFAEPCNLQNIPLPNLDNEEEFILAARLMHRWGKRVTCEKYIHPGVQEVIRRNRRIGTSLTGCLQSPLFNPTTLDKVYAAIQEENINYSKELGIDPSIRTTVIQPGGTGSKRDDMEGFEGVHAAWSRYVIQRIQFSANDPLIPQLRAAGHNIEPLLGFDGLSDPRTLVVDFYIKAPDGAPVADEDWTTWKQLDVLMMAQKHWADQAVSVTVYYKKEEIPQVKQWLTDNLKNIKTISFLCHSDHGFKQAPKEAITKEQYEKFSSKITPLVFNEIKLTDELLEGTNCEGGSCPIR